MNDGNLSLSDYPILHDHATSLRDRSVDSTRRGRAEARLSGHLCRE
ncbi:hypothetical protein FRUB_01100 [Fimbriiglobus ruber]|uniref:Uncharacterized protein n=1 Tax=Fimbriiglobus ruber TaxID=1908690 RepID=A0A225E1F7_9BACT|nr:hypothetical protein FRUB_01100 [Fimbriiglobus ruber]